METNFEIIRNRIEKKLGEVMEKLRNPERKVDLQLLRMKETLLLLKELFAKVEE